jgi:lysozyme
MARKLKAPLAAIAVMGAVGISQLQAHEGLRTRAYLDPVGIPTICYGHTGPDVKMGMVWSRAKCEATLLKDIAVHRAGVEKCVHAPMTPNQRDAVVSFAFNVGVPKFCRSTMARKLNARDYIGAADEFPRWKYARVRGRNVVLRGLVKRRTAERNLFLTPYRIASQQASVAAQVVILQKAED